VRYALVLALTSCGRFAFDDMRSDDGGPPGVEAPGGEASTVRLVVTADYTPQGSGPFVPLGTPIESATVLVDRGTGALERLVTDAEGSVTFDTDGLVAYHVVHGSSNWWRVYTVATGATGTVSLGGVAPTGAGGQVTMVLPTSSDAWFRAHLPEGCQSIFDVSSTPTVSIQYNPACAGQTVRVLGFTTPDFDNVRYVDAGMIKLAPGTRSTVTGTYAAMPTHSIALTNVPAGTQRVSAEILARDQSVLMPMEFSSPDQVQVTGPTMMLTPTAAPGGDTLRVSADMGRVGRAFSSATGAVVPISFSAAPISASFDASTLLAPFTSFDFDSKLNVSWAGGDGTGTMLVMQVSADSFEWHAYLPTTATALSFPVIPADIGFPRAPRVYTVAISRIDVPGATAVGLTPTIDQTFQRWPNDPALFPPSGNRSAGAAFASGLVTDPSATAR
jgi:hypothetical protein